VALTLSSLADCKRERLAGRSFRRSSGRGRGDAQPGDPAAEEDRLGTVALEERLALAKDLAAVVFESARAYERE
jgi:hypothetical protein